MEFQWTSRSSLAFMREGLQTRTRGARSNGQRGAPATNSSSSMLPAHVLKVLWSLLTPRRRVVFLVLVLLLLITGLAEMGSMFLIFGFIRGLTPDDTGHRHGPIARGMETMLGGTASDVSYAVVGGAFVALFVVGKNGLSTLVHFGVTRFMMKLNQNVARKLFEAYLLAPYREILRQGVDRLQRKVTSSFQILNDCFSATSQILADSATLLMVGVLLLFVDPILTLTATALFGVAGTTLYWTMQRKIRVLGHDARVSNHEANRLVWEGLAGLVDMRLRHAHSAMVARYSRALSRSAKYHRRLGGMRNLPRSTNEILLTLMIVGSVVYLAASGQSIQEVVPTLALFGFAGMRLTGAMSRINSSTQALRQKADAFDKFVALVRKLAPELIQSEDVETPPRKTYLTPSGSKDAARIPSSFAEIAFSDVRFAFNKTDPEVIKGVSFRMARGSFVSFCGPSGGGKTTLLLLFMGLLPPTKGKITCDGTPLSADIVGWHRLIGYVGQDFFLTDGSLRENVAFGEVSLDVDDERIWRALDLARAREFVEALPMGLDTRIERGRMLSGGQRQRIAIARALYRNPAVLVLDEATAALDNETERSITDAIASISRDKTVVCVAHRLSTIRQSDVIHFVVDGEIAASGTFDELLSNCPEFKKMAEHAHESGGSFGAEQVAATS